MNDRDLNPYGVLTGPTTLTIQRLLPGPIERVWQYLTDGELRKKWLAAGVMQMKAETQFEFIWRNEELSDPPGHRPDGVPQEQRMQCHVVEADPPNRLVITWQGSGNVSFDLEQKGDKVLFTVVHAQLPDRSTLLKVGAGWHMHLDLLGASLTGDTRAPFWPGWAQLHEEYSRRLPT